MGRTTPVVFLHAYPLDRSMWDAQLRAFSDRETLAPNFPGFGGRPPGEPSLDAFAAAVVSDMDSARFDRAAVVGLSMGGYVAFRLLAGWVDRIERLVLADTRAGPDDDDGKERRSQQAERARREGPGWLPEAMLPVLLGETTRSERPEVVDEVRRLLSRAEPEGVARALLAMRDRPDSAPLLPEIQIPVLALVGEEDRITPPSEARRIAEGARDGQVLTLPRAGHLSNIENPAAFNAALRTFLDG